MDNSKKQGLVVAGLATVLVGAGSFFMGSRDVKQPTAQNRTVEKRVKRPVATPVRPKRNARTPSVEKPIQDERSVRDSRQRGSTSKPKRGQGSRRPPKRKKQRVRGV